MLWNGALFGRAYPNCTTPLRELQFLLDELGWGVTEWAQQAASWSQQRHRFKNTAAIGIDDHNRAGPVP
jgi:hypothetical protein